jgi:hypothetical protein
VVANLPTLPVFQAPSSEDPVRALEMAFRQHIDVRRQVPRQQMHEGSGIRRIMPGMMTSSERTRFFRRTRRGVTVLTATLSSSPNRHRSGALREGERWLGITKLQCKVGWQADKARASWPTIQGRRGWERHKEQGVRTGGFDPETITLLTAALEEAWSIVPERQRRALPQSMLAERILRTAARGERDPARLRASALVDLMPGAYSAPSDRW